MEVLLGPMRPSVAGGRVYVPAEMRRDEKKYHHWKRSYEDKKRGAREEEKHTDCVGLSLSLSLSI